MSDGRIECRRCGRGFARERIEKHENICKGLENFAIRQAPPGGSTERAQNGIPPARPGAQVRAPPAGRNGSQAAPGARNVPGRQPPPAQGRAAPAQISRQGARQSAGQSTGQVEYDDFSTQKPRQQQGAARGHAPSPGPSRFCGECGGVYATATAKFCTECGQKRQWELLISIIMRSGIATARAALAVPNWLWDKITAYYIHIITQ